MKFEVADDGSARYSTADGDILDLIAFNFYGSNDGTTEFVLNANPGLAALGSVYDAGVRIILPHRPRLETAKPQISLRD